MPNASDSLLNYLRTMAGALRDDPRSDAELMAQYAKTGDETVFRVLVCRHGLLVWRTCRRVLGDTPDAEDVFQSTFMALTRKAGWFPVKSLAGWLHRVARQAALNVRFSAKRHRVLEQQIPSLKQQLPEMAVDQAELHAALDEELASLPERLRVPLLLHYLEGKSQVEVARVLGCARRALQKRLARGEAILRTRLEQRGLALGIGSMAMLLGSKTEIQTVPAGLIANTMRAAVAFRVGTLTDGSAAVGAQKLLHALAMEGTVRKVWWVSLLCVITLGIGGTGWIAWKIFKDGSDAAVPTLSKLAAPENSLFNSATAELHGKRIDCYGDPLPDGAIARIGTIRFRSGSQAARNAPTEGGDFGDAAFLPDGKTLVSVHRDGFIHFWETATGKEIRRLEVPANCQKIAVSPDGKKLAVIASKSNSGVEEPCVMAWDLSKTLPRQLCRRSIVPGQYAIAFAPDCKALAVSSNGLRLFDVATGAWRHVVKIHLGPTRLVYSHDGKTLAAGGRLWDTSTWTKRHDLKELLKGEIAKGEYSASFSPDDNALAIAHWDAPNVHALHIWDVATGALRCRLAGEDHNSFVAFMSDGRSLLENKGNNIYFWDSTNGTTKLSKDITCSNRNEFQETPDGTCLSPDGKILARANCATVDLWDVTTGREVGPVEANRGVRALALSPDNKTLVTLKDATELRIWEAETGRFVRKLARPDNGLILDPIEYNGRRIVVPMIGLMGGMFGLIGYDAQSGGFSNEALSPRLSTEEKPVNYAVSPGGRWQLWKSLDKLILIDRSTGKEVCNSILAPKDMFAYMSVSADGHTVLLQHRSQEDYSQLEVWSSKTSKRRMNQRVDFPDSERPVTALSPDGRWVAFVAGTRISEQMEYESAIQLWEVTSGTIGERFRTDGVALGSVAWSPDGRLLAGGDVKGGLWLWDAVSGKLLRHNIGHRGGVRALVFSLDGRRLVSGSYDTTALVWDLPDPLPGEGKTREAKIAQLPSADTLWAALQSQDAAKARPAIYLLVQNTDVSLPLLHERLQQVFVPDETQVAKLLGQLDDNDFQIRKRAKEQLAKMGALIEPVLQEELAKKPSVEVRESVDWLLRKIAESTISSEQLQACRGIEVLERIGTPAARQILEKLSRLPTGVVQADEARAALKRLTNSTHDSMR